ncbi:alpha/beta fold hydrolase [Cognatiyoonia sp. IB215446]|uniref:alpha/beta fold hydrolase n=1 Tax=Cognatiyoonia sp. IB215446 TaxID=3097355 RepID=UPI002A165677|nr:alpha/beta fold hydrolase [Cognatiyoonia sp. IB215446]MDX8346894.1 alpha/beta fold hydrolase [Cognatiyoonia sp. IB215446]
MLNTFEINVMSEMSLYKLGTEVPLVSSRKTRALLAYLAITGTSHRREHLCEMFFDNTNDPRAALRWSLSKLRPPLKDQTESKLITSDDSISLDMTGVHLDANFVRSVHNDAKATTKQLRQAATLLSQRPLSSLALSGSQDYELWLLSECEELQALRGGIIQKLVKAADTPDPEAVKWLRLWCRLEPFSHDAPFELWQKLTSLGRKDDAKTVLNHYKLLMAEDAQDWTTPVPAIGQPRPVLHKRQQIGFCKTQDGIRIAHAKVGLGPALVKAASGPGHLELEWNSPVWKETFQALAANNTFIRYDGRGTGLSEPHVDAINLQSFADDLAAVVDTHDLDRFPLLGTSQGCATAIQYALANPDRVSALILIGGYDTGWRIGGSEVERQRREAMLTLARLGWDQTNPACRNVVSQTLMPDADQARLDWFNDFQRHTASAENAARIEEASAAIDIADLLPQLNVPTLVLHARGDEHVSAAYGRKLAAEIPHAQFVTLESRNHLLLGDEPAWKVCMDEITAFLLDHG